MNIVVTIIIISDFLLFLFLPVAYLTYNGIKDKVFRNMCLGIITIIALCFSVWMVNIGTYTTMHTPTVTDTNIQVCIIAQGVVCDSLKTPSTAVFPLYDESYILRRF